MSLLQHLIPSLNRASAADPAPAPAGTNLGPSVKPAYEVKETAEAFGLVVHLPGVAKEGLDLTVDAGEVRLVGRRTWQTPEGWTSLYRETSDAPYALVLTHDNAIDAGKVAAELADGVLRVSLPKVEAIKPRKIALN